MSSIAGTNKKRGRGRPVVNSTSVNLRLAPDMLAALDALIADSPDPKPTRPEAIRQILATSLNFVARDRRG